MVEVIGTDEFEAWFLSLSEEDSRIVLRLVEALEIRGVTLGFPLCSSINGSKYPLRELRGHGKPLRILYAFDPKRQAVLLIGGDKTGDARFYEWIIPLAEKIWAHYLSEDT